MGPPIHQGLFKDTKSTTRDIVVWEISMQQTKQTNYLPS